MTRKGDVFAEVRKPTHLIALAALIGVCVLFFFLGKWQWDRTQNILNAERAASEQAIPISDIAAEELQPEDFGRSITAAGTYIPEHQVRVTNRLENGQSNAQVGEWVVSEFVDDSGVRIAVLRGWVPTAADFSTPIESVMIEGVLQPSEAFYEGAVSSESGVVVIDSAQLSAIWDTDLASGFVVLTDQQPGGESPQGSNMDPAPVPPTISTSDVAFPLQNFFYAIQWWIFGIFAIAVYFRWIVVSARERSQVEHHQ
jgi:cytochrome oxidase assembly protein ShyY1